MLQAAIAEVDRYRSMDQLIPSVYNVVTVAALEVRTLSYRYICAVFNGFMQFNMAINIANMVPTDPKVFFTSTRLVSTTSCVF